MKTEQEINDAMVVLMDCMRAAAVIGHELGSAQMSYAVLSWAAGCEGDCLEGRLAKGFEDMLAHQRRNAAAIATLIGDIVP